MTPTDGSHDDALITGINVTPLVDVALVLLIILMVTASYVATKAIPLELPNGATGESTEAPLAISIDRLGRTYLDAHPIEDAELRARVGSAHRLDPRVRAILAADGATSHRAVVRVIDLLRQEGVARFAIQVDPAGERP